MIVLTKEGKLESGELGELDISTEKILRIIEDARGIDDEFVSISIGVNDQQFVISTDTSKIYIQKKDL
jgi:malonyl CoA-acyl carrier protein transacylase